MAVNLEHIEHDIRNTLDVESLKQSKLSLINELAELKRIMEECSDKHDGIKNELQKLHK